MAQYLSDVTALSSKGQIVLPKAIRPFRGHNSHLYSDRRYPIILR